MQVIDRLQTWRREGSLPVAPGEVRHFQRLLTLGRADEALERAAPLATRLAADEATRGWVPGVVLGAGLVLAAHERNLEARQYLREGLAMLPGTPSEQLVGDAGTHAVVLVELCMLTGATDEARRWAEHLAQPEQSVEVRLAATRALARLRQVLGDHEGAHWLLNAATDLATKTCSRLLTTVVESDRAAVLAEQGRTQEAVRMAEEAAIPLLEPQVGPHALLACCQAAATTATVSRACAQAGNVDDAVRLLTLAQRGAGRSARRLPWIGALLAEAVIRRMTDDAAGAEQAAAEAARLAAEVSAAPLEALAHHELGLAALAAGRPNAAIPLLVRARDGLLAGGLVAESRATTVALEQLRAAPADI